MDLTNAREITLKTVLHQIQQAGTVFSLAFRKLDGSYCYKEQVKKNPTKVKDPESLEKKDLSSIQRNMTKAGVLILYDELEGHPFEVKVELMVGFNGYKIFHNY